MNAASFAHRLLLIVLFAAVPASAQATARPQMLVGHRTKIACLAVSPDGALLASGGGDKSTFLGFGRAAWLDCTIRLWDARSGELLRAIEGHQQTITHLAFSADGRLLASASPDNTVRVWNTQDGAMVRQFAGVRGAISADGRWVAAAPADGPIDLFDIQTGEQRQQMVGHINGALMMAFSPDGALLTSAGADGAVRIWDTRTGKAVVSFAGLGLPLCLGFSGDGGQVVWVGQDKTLRTWGTQNWQAGEVRELGPADRMAAGLSPDATRLAIVADGVAQLRDVATGVTLATVRPPDTLLGQAIPAPDGKRLFATSPISTHVLVVPVGIRD